MHRIGSVVVLAVVACGGRQSGSAGDRCAKVPAGTVLDARQTFYGGFASYQPPDGQDIVEGEHVSDGKRRWGMTFDESSEGAIAWVVETPTAIQIGYRRSSGCGGPPRERSGIAVYVPGTKPIVAVRCGGMSTCQPGVR